MATRLEDLTPLTGVYLHPEDPWLIVRGHPPREEDTPEDES